MRPVNQAARDQFTAVLSRQPGSRAGELAARLDVSVATVHRMVRAAGSHVLTIGRAGRTRYVARRPLRGDSADLPLYSVDAEGNAQLVTGLALAYPQGSRLALPQGGTWSIPKEARDGWWDGLPYPVFDMRPQGYMGRQLAHAESARFQVSADLTRWSEEDIVVILANFGSDTTGNLILGNTAYERWLRTKVAPTAPLQPHAVADAYVLQAAQAVEAGAPGSSAAGEFPKFMSARELAGSATPHVLVKFSGAGDSTAVQRWSDLLLCEHHALACACQLPGIESARSRIVQAGGRTFLEVERFDRAGLFGRKPLCSLEAIHAEFLGTATSDWTALGAQMIATGLLPASDLTSIEYLWWYGQLIANSDMHLGNLSFQPDRLFKLAPAYDMLPMYFAPLPGGELPARTFNPALPRPPQRATWNAANRVAMAFWERAADDSRISLPFRAICSATRQRLMALAAIV